MNASHQNNALEHEKLVAALEICKKTHGQTDWHKLQEELASAKDYIQRSESQKAELEATIVALEADISSRVCNNILHVKLFMCFSRVSHLKKHCYSLQRHRVSQSHY